MSLKSPLLKSPSVYFPKEISHPIKGAFKKALNKGVLSRLKKRDASLWTHHPRAQDLIRHRLGWLEAPGHAQGLLSDIMDFRDTILREGYQTVVLLGMGGSVLAAEVYQRTFGPKKGFPRLRVLDTTDPDTIHEAASKLNLKKTLFIVSSKSGTTMEPYSLFRFFYKASGSSGHQFIAITDSGTELEKLGRAFGFRKLFLGDPDVGGRFSALTVFGLVPALLIGIPLKRVIERAVAAQRSLDRADLSHPALQLGISLGVLAKKGIDKLTLFTSKELGAFSDWAEQLISESLGKSGKGVLPIVHEKLTDFSHYPHDRFFVALTLGSDSRIQRHLLKLRRENHPWMHFQIEKKTDIGMLFYLWECAAALAGSLLGINPFDEPDVQEAKELARAFLKKSRKGKRVKRIPGAQRFKIGSFSGWSSKAVKDRDPWNRFWSDLRSQGVLHCLAFLPRRMEILRALSTLRDAILRKTSCAVSIGFGPRYLHSTGQLHKGGPNQGLFLMLGSKKRCRIAIPHAGFSFGDLERAQAMGDFEALHRRNRRVLYLELQDPAPRGLMILRRLIRKALVSTK